MSRYSSSSRGSFLPRVTGYRYAYNNDRERAQDITAPTPVTWDQVMSGIGADRSSVAKRRSVSVSLFSAMAGHVHCQFQPTPDSEFVKCTAQMVLDHLFAGADDLANFAIGQAFPDQNRNLTFLWVETGARCHDLTFVFVNIAGQLHPFTSVEDSGSQKQHAKVLFYGARTDI